MADFATSTHRAKWIFTPQDLKEKYRDANQRARQALERYGATRMEVDIDGSFSYAEPQNAVKDNAEKRYRTKPLKTEEELLRAFYEFKIQDVCDAFKFPRKIKVKMFDCAQIVKVWKGHMISGQRKKGEDLVEGGGMD